jgi:hypothetical protein
MRLKVEIRESDAGYVEEKVGAELYVHLRAVPAIVDFRRAAIERASSLHADCDPADECRRGALGLLLLQRAMFAIEDLGGLLYALDEPPSFERLVSYGLRDISTTFARLFADPELTPRLYGFGSAASIDDEPGLRDEQRQALKHLATITQMRVDGSLAKVRVLWDASHDDAKKTMHGLAFAAGRYAVEPPGAGMMTRALPPNHPRPFAVPLTTRIVDPLARHVNTEVGVLSLTPGDVERFRGGGLAACEATEVLVGGRLHGLETNHAFTVPKTYLDQLAPEHRAAIEPLFDR